MTRSGDRLASACCRIVGHALSLVSVVVLVAVLPRPVRAAAPGAATVGVGIVFEFTEIGGERHVDPIWTADCKRYDITVDSPIVEPIEKSGAMDDDFSRSWLADPLVRLPPGTWEIAAIADFIEGPDCPGPSFTLRAAVRVQVEE